MTETFVGKRRKPRNLILALTLVFGTQIAASYALLLPEDPASSLRLEQIPATLNDWTLANEEPLEPDVAAYLKPDDYIQRTYLEKPSGIQANLFVAYFKSLQNTYGPHSPRVCLPGTGWLVRLWKVIRISVPGEPTAIPINEFVLEKGDQQILVLYWYQNERRIWAQEYEFKLHLLPDLLRYHRSDVSLVRIVTPINGDEPLEAPLKRAIGFARDLFPDLLRHFRQAA